MSLVQEFRNLVGERHVLTKPEDIAYASIDQSNGVEKCAPCMVIKVYTQQQLIDAVRIALKHKTPLVIRAAGSGKTGGAVGQSNSVVIDILGLNRIINIDRHNFLAHVEPGVILKDFKEAVLNCGLFYPVDPASQDFCTLGGNVAENAAGPSSLKYGTTRDYVLGGTAIIGTGDIINFGKNCHKGVAGFDIGSLLCGSEGCLAVFTSLTLRLLPKPQGVALAIVYFTDEAQALAAVNKILLAGHRPRALEYIDQVCLNALRKIQDVPKSLAALIIECDAMSSLQASEQIDAITTLLGSKSISHITKTTQQHEIHAHWHSRSLLSDACTKYLGYKISEDIAVPLEKLLLCAQEIRALAKPPNIVCGVFGHAGDGNLHVQIMFDNPKIEHEASGLAHKVLSLVVRLGGTIAAEHGIGLKKKAYLPLEQSLELIELQKRLKLAFDPYNLLNPGKIFDV